MQHSRRKARAAISLALLMLVALGAPAFGHAALTGSTPKDGATLDSVPSEVEINYSEPPTTDIALSVIDGCEREVARSVQVLNLTASADVSSGQPGEWKVRWAVVSAVDGHLTRDGIDFSVEGVADCEQTATDEMPHEESPGAPFPIWPMGLATILVVGVALFVRLRSN